MLYCEKQEKVAMDKKQAVSDNLGVGETAAKARSLGIKVIFAGADMAAFKRGTEQEAKTILANSNGNIKISTNYKKL